jgi:hypothetical protein
MTLSKPLRLKLFFEKLEQAPPCGSYEIAYNLLCKTLNEVENEYSGVKDDITNYMNDNRLYPPLEDSIMNYKNREDLICFRNKRNYTFFSKTGSITITDFSYKILFEKADIYGKRNVL